MDSGRNFVGFNFTITTSSEHVTNVSFLVVTTREFCKIHMFIQETSKPVTLNQNPIVMLTCF